MLKMINKLLSKIQWHLHNAGAGDMGNFVQDIRDKIKRY
nr:MAG: hypothetical protein [Bacteriophage sp.]